ncbi:MAG TPA: proton-conducting transporter membrane subunit [Anaerolineae bacterium]|nr:proton-conducting transporter membrane subunit [Anaerolineae bacterium]
MNAAYFVWLIALPLALSPVVYLTGRLWRLARGTALIALVATWAPFALAARDLSASGPASFTLGTIMLRMDGLSLLLAALVLALSTLVVLFSGPYIAGEIGEEKYYAMLVAMAGVMIGLGCAADLFNLWLWFEAMAVTSYLLVAFYRDRPASLEAGVKYLVQSATGSAFVLLGIALVMAQAGTLNLDQIHASARQAQALPLLAAGALFVIGFGVKIAMVPMHTWLPDAHAQAPSGISAMLSGVVIEAGLVALLRALAALAGVTASWGVLLMGFGAVNMLAGNLLALRQTHVKRLLAFSSLSHIGYMLLGLGIGVYAGEVAGAQGGLFHLLNHGLMKGLAFLAAGALLYVLHAASADHGPLMIADLAGAARRYPVAALTLSIAVLGLGGLPPLAGFMSKWQIFVAGFETHQIAIEALVIFAALNSVLSLGYYVPLVNAVYRLRPSDAVQRGRPLPVLMSAPLAIMGLAVVAVGVWPGLLQWLTEPAGAALLAAFGGF